MLLLLFRLLLYQLHTLKNIYDDTRYNNVSPAESVKDFLTGISTGFAEKFNDGIQTLADSFRDNCY